MTVASAAATILVMSYYVVSSTTSPLSVHFAEISLRNCCNDVSIASDVITSARSSYPTHDQCSQCMYICYSIAARHEDKSDSTTLQ